MRPRSRGLGSLFALAVVLGCSPPPKVTTGTFTTSYTVHVDREHVDVVVLTSGPATYEVKNYAMDHPMGQRPDTEATVRTPAGRFAITDRGAPPLQLAI